MSDAPLVALSAIARALIGELVGKHVLAPGPEHDVPAGRTLAYRPAPATGDKGALKRFPLLPEPVRRLSVHWEPDAADDVRQCVERWRAAGQETIRLDSLIGKDAADSLWEGS